MRTINRRISKLEQESMRLNTKTVLLVESYPDQTIGEAKVEAELSCNEDDHGIVFLSALDAGTL